MWYNILYNKKLKDCSLSELRELIFRAEDFNLLKDPRFLRQLTKEYTLTFWAKYLKDKFNDPRDILEIKEIIKYETKCEKLYH